MTNILACCNAVVDFMPCRSLYKGKRKQYSWLDGGPEGATYDCNASGWMESNNFYKWFSEVFVPYVLDGHKLLFLDGHGSHISLELIDKAREQNIILFKIIAHSSHVLQPLDVAVFSSAKSTWYSEMINIFDRTG